MNLRFVAFLALLGACLAREKRSIGWFAPTTESPLSKYPVWKVHKYTGIDLKPVNVPFKTHEIEEEHVGEELPKAIDIHDFSSHESHHEDIEHLSEFLPRSYSDKNVEVLGEHVEKEAEDKIGIVPRLVLKKKKKHVLGLLALSNLLSEGKIKLGKGGLSALIKGLIGEEETPETSFYPGQTTIYRDVPSSSPSFFSKIPFIGGFGQGSTVHLPEPSLPSFPALKLVPELPKIPKLNLPGPYKVPYSTGSYVRIKVPHPTFHDEKHEVYSPPATSYGVPEHIVHETPYHAPEHHIVHESPAPYPAPDHHTVHESAPHPAPEHHTVHQSPAPYPALEHHNVHQSPAPYPAPEHHNVHQSPAPYPAHAVHHSPAPYPAPVHQTPVYKKVNEPEYGLPSPVPAQQFAPSAPHPPPPPPSPPSEYGAPSFNHKYTGPSSYQTTFDSAPYASELKPIVVAAPEEKSEESKEKEMTSLEEKKKN